MSELPMFMYLLEKSVEWDDSTYSPGVFTSVEKAQRYLDSRCGAGVAVLRPSFHGSYFAKAEADNEDEYTEYFHLRAIEADPE